MRTWTRHIAFKLFADSLLENIVLSGPFGTLGFTNRVSNGLAYRIKRCHILKSYLVSRSINRYVSLKRR